MALSVTMTSSCQNNHKSKIINQKMKTLYIEEISVTLHFDVICCFVFYHCKHTMLIYLKMSLGAGVFLWQQMKDEVLKNVAMA